MNRIIDFYVEQFLWDVNVMSNPWMYIPLLIPIICFLVFFFVKWWVITLPFWLPISLALRLIKITFTRK